MQFLAFDEREKTTTALGDFMNFTRRQWMGASAVGLLGAMGAGTRLSPLAQAMAALTDETRQTLAEIERKSQEQGETFKRQLSESVKGYKDAAAAASQAASFRPMTTTMRAARRTPGRRNASTTPR